MTYQDILEIIKDKRHNAYCDYECNVKLQMKEENRQSYQARKDTISKLISAINTYDDLIIIIENRMYKEQALNNGIKTDS